jgi:[methyl-Co(III) methanol-specific corrinoid protein]:coenzyme M methyltransferase
MSVIAQTGADAICVDQLTDLGQARKILHDTLLFGNIDPVAALWQGDAAEIKEAVRAAKAAGVDAVWPGCDLVPQTPLENIRTMSTAGTVV